MLSQVAVVVVAFVMTVEPAAFKFEFADPAEAAVAVVKVDGAVVRPGKVYEVAPFSGTKTVRVEVNWVENGKSVQRVLKLELTAGYLSEFRLTIPREFI